MPPGPPWMIMVSDAPSWGRGGDHLLFLPLNERRFPSSPPSSSPPCLLTLCSLHMHDLLGGGMIETAGVQMTAKSRIELMQKLSRNPQTQKTGDDGGQHEGVGLGAETSPHPSSSSRPSSALPPMPQISRCIVLRHMFSTEE